MTEPNVLHKPRSLDQLQRWMQSVITHPAGIEAGVMSDSSREASEVGAGRLDEVVLPSQRLSSADRLRVYGNAYFARLLECLRAEFPAMVKALGEEAFEGLAFGYLLKHPSCSDTLTRLAATLPEYLEETRPPRESLESGVDSNEETAPDFADFLIDLARLERTYSEVFDAERCLRCHVGTHASAFSSSCSACQPGRFCVSADPDSSGTPCPAGTYNPKAGSWKPSDCLPCPPGTQSFEGSAYCYTCPLGTYCPASNTAQVCAPRQCFFL